MSNEKRPKRSRDTEEAFSPPKCKQTKIDDFVREGPPAVAVYKIPVSNRFAALAQEESKLEERIDTEEVSPSPTLAEMPCCDCERNLCSITKLTFLIVKHILGYLKDIKEKLEKLPDMGRAYVEDKIPALDAEYKSDKLSRKYPSPTAFFHTSLNLDNSVEEELKDVFPKLPREDQVVIVDRLELLKNSLLALGNQCGSLDSNTLRETSSQHIYKTYEESERPGIIMNSAKVMAMLSDSNNLKTYKEAVRNDKKISDSGSYSTITKPSSKTNTSSAVALVDLTPNFDIQTSSSPMIGNPYRLPTK
ncbi:UNVERIFIED_CONTAM: hypothetical protein K2H54_069126 [Gekko kuhli]